MNDNIENVLKILIDLILSAKKNEFNSNAEKEVKVNVMVDSLIEALLVKYNVNNYESAVQLSDFKFTLKSILEQ